MMLCKSSPTRCKDLCCFTTISKYKSPGSPPPGPTSPRPTNWTLVPVSTPAGICAFKVARVLTLPSPEHSEQGLGKTVPNPEHCGQGLLETT